MSQLKIEQALIQQWVAGGFSLPTVYENSKESNPSPPYARLTTIHAKPSQGTVGSFGENEHTGLTQIDLLYPASTGKHVVLQKADEISAHFQSGDDFTYDGVTVTVDYAALNSARNEDNFYRAIYSIHWRSRIARLR
jgi:hypothetical protein